MSAVPTSSPLPNPGYVICHQDADLGWAQYLHQQLHQMGIPARLKAVDVRAGDNVVQLEHQWLQDLQGALVVVSQHFDADAQVRVWTAALAADYRIVPVLVDNVPLPGLLAGREPVRLHGLRVESDVQQLLRSALAGAGGGAAPLLPLPGRTVATGLVVAPAGALRGVLDRVVPRLHLALTRRGLLSMPQELAALHGYLGDLQAALQQELHQRSYVPLDAGPVPDQPTVPGTREDPFVRPVQQLIRQVVGTASGGDGATAQLSASSRKSRVVRNIAHALLRSPEPLVLLGDPGSGKTMTLQNAVLAVLQQQLRSVYPTLPIYVRLGDFHVSTPRRAGPEDVRDFVLRQVDSRVALRWDALHAQGRLMVFFDGMDEMSRANYGQHIEALSVFAGSSQVGSVRTLFSCRINDFSPEFKHRRMVLLPFERAQLREFLERYIPSWPLAIEGVGHTLRSLTARLWAGDVPVDPRNPFVLWLLLFYLRARGRWPHSRPDLLAFYARRSFERKRGDAVVADAVRALDGRPFKALSQLAFVLMQRNRGTSASWGELRPGLAGLDLGALGVWGQHCGLLALSAGGGQGSQAQVRFTHHRLAEFFAARHIQRSGAAIDWLAVMDAPRWQETLVNLALMTGAGQTAAPVAQLASVISVEIEAIAEREQLRERIVQARSAREQQLKDKKAAAEKAGKATTKPEAEVAAESTSQTEPERAQAVADDAQPDLALADQALPELIGNAEETALADRVDLLSRLLRQHAAHGTEMLQVLTSAIARLVAVGNPSTQVKLLWAWKNVPSAPVGADMARLLNSPVAWVRNQALLLVAESPVHRGQLGTDLSMEIGLDLARGELPQRWAGHAKAALTGRGGRAWWSLGLGTLMYLLWVAALVASCAALYTLAPMVVPADRVPAAWLTPATYATGVGLAGALALLLAPSKLWLALLGVALGLWVAAVQGPVVWAGSHQGASEGFLLLGMGLAIPGLALLPAWPLHVMLLACYALSSGGFTHLGLRLRNFILANSDRCGYGRAAGSWYFAVAVALGMMKTDWLTQQLQPVFDAIERSFVAFGLDSGLPFSPAVNAWLALAAALALTVMALLVTRWREPVTSRVRKGVQLLFGSMLLGLVFAPLMWLLFWLDRLVAPWVAPWLGPVVISLVAITAALLVAWLLWQTLATLAAWLSGLQRPFAPGSLSADSWRTLLVGRSARRQDAVLQRSSHQALGVEPAQYLALLVQLQPAINGEPALGTYWRLRHELEQMLRQEHPGKIGTS